MYNLVGAIVAMAALYYAWRTCHEAHCRRAKVLPQRVAYMLWIMAQSEEPAIRGWHGYLWQGEER
jgi:hypothetical protein